MESDDVGGETPSWRRSGRCASDLDVVMTSEREWGFYSTVPGIATHQLVRREGVDAVHVSVWEWDGAVAAQVAHGVRDRPSRDRSATGGSDEEGLF
jgi:hypothetical protein